MANMQFKIIERFDLNPGYILVKQEQIPVYIRPGEPFKIHDGKKLWEGEIYVIKSFKDTFSLGDEDINKFLPQFKGTMFIHAIDCQQNQAIIKFIGNGILLKDGVEVV